MTTTDRNAREAKRLRDKRADPAYRLRETKRARDRYALRHIPSPIAINAAFAAAYAALFGCAPPEQRT